MDNSLNIKTLGRDNLKDLLSQCTEDQQMLFKRMYSHDDLERDINDAVDQMPDDKINWAISQCERTVYDNAIKEKNQA
jgi:hypothetical protein